MTKGSYTLVKEGEALKLNFKMSVRKSGMSGTGMGPVGLVIFDENFEPVFKIQHGLTVGAKVPQGTNTKTWGQGVTITGEKAKHLEKAGLVLAFNVNTISDRLGIPTSLNEWKDAIKETAAFASEVQNLAVGSSMQKGDWKFIKLAGL